MTRVSRSAVVPFSPAKMYRLVNAIDTYPRFLPACHDASIWSQTAHEIKASLTLQKGPLKMAFTTRNRLSPDRRIDMKLEEGPFKRLDGVWSFEPIGEEGGEGGCVVTFELDYEFTNRILKATVGKLFEPLAGSLVDACCRSARQVYG